jgi:glucosamine kinase
MKLIADSGGTKTQWCGISDTSDSDIVTTIGLNPNFVTGSAIMEVIISQVIPKLKKENIEEVWFYGAGCAGEAASQKVREAIIDILPEAFVTVETDLTGAARGLLGHRGGYVCMIGTGSNSGFYDGEKISENVPPLGFILGDEGSGAALGKKLLADYLRGLMPNPLSEEFRKRYGAEKDDVVKHVYSGVFPSKFIGGFVRFIKEYIDKDYCQKLVRSSFEEFVERNLKLYNINSITDIAVSGSVAWYFRGILEEVFRNNGFRITRIVKDPINGLISYHKSKLP